MPDVPFFTRKPSVRPSSAAYAIIQGIDYIIEECPNSVGAKSLLYKEALNLLEQAAPGTKQSLYWGFLERGRPLVQAQDDPNLRACVYCGQPTTAEVCAFCRMTERAAARMRVRRQSVPVPEDPHGGRIIASHYVAPAG